MASGVGIQSYKLLQGLNKTGKYEIVEIAGSIKPLSPNPTIYEGIKLYPTGDGYGNPQIVRKVFTAEKPDIVVAFSDPRFFIYLFMMDNEIRKTSKLVFYHTWDNDPFPKFNLPFYSACDEIVMLSNFSYNLISSNNVTCSCIPHGMDPSEFYPLPDEIVKQERESLLRQAGRSNINFIIFWNNRNIARKRPGDVYQIFREFSKKHPDSLLLMHTQPIDREGTDLYGLMNDILSDSPVVLSTSKFKSDRLNVLYNVSDVTLNIAYNEGFGLSVAESLCAGTPNIAVKTGGMIEQMTDGTNVFGRLLEPNVKSLFGVPGAPYIYRDFVSNSDVVNALEHAYDNKKEWKELGMSGRDHIINNFHINSTVQKWDELLQTVVKSPSTYKPWKFSIH